MSSRGADREVLRVYKMLTPRPKSLLAPGRSLLRYVMVSPHLTVFDIAMSTTYLVSLSQGGENPALQHQGAPDQTDLLVPLQRSSSRDQAPRSQKLLAQSGDRTPALPTAG